ncbi:hypothetical protein ACJJTC_009801 [Scirpophaga incertulas]
MSSSRGNISRQRPQKYQNKTAFKNDLHDTSHRTKLLNSLQISGVCKRCKDIIEWKIKYKKYKPLAAPRKCTGCEQKTIKHAYHLLCINCSSKKKVCSKCGKSFEEIHLEENNVGPDIEHMLKGIPERKRRTVLRYMNKEQNDQKNLSPDVKTYIENLISNIDKISIDNDFDDSNSDDENNDESFQ